MASTVNGQGTGQSSLRVSTTQGASKKSDSNPSLDKLGGGGGAAPNTNPTDGGKTVTASDIALKEAGGKMQLETGAPRESVKIPGTDH